MFKEDIVDIMSEAIEADIIAHHRHKNVPENDIEQMVKWQRPQLDHANDIILTELINRGLVTVDVIE